MLQREIILPPETDPARIGPLVERLCREEELSLGLKATLRTYAGSLHWHWKLGRERGTLEVTHWPQNGRLWISVHENRSADWTDDAAEKLAGRMEAALGTTFALGKI